MKLSDAQIHEIQNSGESLAKLSAKYGVSETAIAYHKRRKGNKQSPAKRQNNEQPPKSPRFSSVKVEGGFLVFRVPIAGLFESVS